MYANAAVQPRKFDNLENLPIGRRSQFEIFHSKVHNSISNLSKQAFIELCAQYQISERDLYSSSWAGNPLIACVTVGNYPVLDYIVEKAGKDILNRIENSSEVLSTTGVFSAARTPEMVEKLITLGADVKICYSAWSPLRTALHFAEFDQKYFEVAKCLIKHQAPCFPPLQKGDLGPEFLIKVQKLIEGEKP